MKPNRPLTPRAKQLRLLKLFTFTAVPAFVILLYILGRPVRCWPFSGYWCTAAYFAFNDYFRSGSTPTLAAPSSALSAAGAATGAEVSLAIAADDATGAALASFHEEKPAEQVTVEEKTHHLTPELVLQHSKRNIVMVTWANDHYFDFVMNWVTHLRKLNVTNFLVGAMDDKLLHRLLGLNVPTFAMRSGLTTADFGWGTATFHKMGREKINLIRIFVSMGFDILVSDVDTVWMRDPLEYMERYPEADILASSDHLSTTVQDDGLEHYAQASSPANIGILFVRKAGLELVNEWNKILEDDEKVWDQNAFNDLFRRGLGPELPNRLFPAYNGKLKLGILPVSLFCSGHTFFVQQMHRQLKPPQDAYVVHATFQFAGTDGKRHRMRESMIWESDTAEHYDPKGGFLAFTPDIPDALLAGYNSKEGHFALVNWQLRQVRDGLALAQALNRTLVLPRMVCGWDRWWAPHAGTIPNSALQNPYSCPADHIFDLEAWWRPRDWAEYGPEPRIREYSVLQNPRMPEAVRSSRVVVDVCVAEGSACSSAALVKLSAPVTDAAAVALFAPLRDVKILELTSIVGVFGGFAEPLVQARFHKRLKEYTGIWCCIHAHPGHIWYDMLWDVPHTDRHNRVFNDSKWPLLLGP